MHTLIIVENNSVPFDRRVWYEATALRDAGWKVSVICPEDKDRKSNDEKHALPSRESDIYEGIRIYRFPLAFANQGIAGYFREYTTAFFYIFSLAWKVWQNDHFDVLHICNPPDIFFPIAKFYKGFKVAFVFDHHDLFPEMVSERYRGIKRNILYRLARWTELLTCKSADHIITTNQSFREVELTRDRIPSEKITIVRNGPRISDFHPVDPKPELKKGFTYMVCFVGIMGDYDGIHELLEIIRYVIIDLDRKDILFEVIGDGSNKDFLIRGISAWGLDGYVDLPGMIKDDFLLRAYMSTADVLISPEPRTKMNMLSTFIKIGEYMAIGKPIVAFDLKETRNTAHGACEYVENGQIEKFGKVISELTRDAERRSKMGDIGRQRAKELLCWEVQQKILNSVYNSVYRASENRKKRHASSI
jgi:glycosyltransferase involved in cell wall biosynthesis